MKDWLSLLRKRALVRHSVFPSRRPVSGYLGVAILVSHGLLEISFRDVAVVAETHRDVPSELRGPGVR